MKKFEYNTTTGQTGITLERYTLPVARAVGWYYFAGEGHNAGDQTPSQIGLSPSSIP